MPMEAAAPELEGDKLATELDAFAARLAPAAHKSRPVRELHAILASGDPALDYAARVAFIDRLVRWLRAGKLPSLGVEPDRDESPRSARLRFLVRALETTPSFRTSAAAVVHSVLTDCSAFGLLGKLGLPGDRGLLAESMDRISRRLLPSVPDAHDLAQLVARWLPGQKDARWLATLEPDLAGRFVRVLGEGETFEPLRRAAADAALLLATRVSALGLSDDIRARSPAVPLRESPLFELPRACDALLSLLESPGSERDRIATAFERVGSLLAGCQRTVDHVVRELEHRGVSVDVVYRLEVMTKNMARLRALMGLLVAEDPAVCGGLSAQLVSSLVEARLRDRSILDLTRTNLHLLARKIIERAGDTGEHYITESRSEYRGMLLSAAGGGVLTAGTAALKFNISAGHFAPFVEGFLSSCNYAGSFLILQALGLTLATKQPSMTAAALAGTIRETAGRPDLSELVSMIARITRSQLAAVIGNIGAVVPAAFLLDYSVLARTGHSALSTESAEHLLQSLHPMNSGTIGFAALTGVLLWASSLAAGWVENWAVYRQLPEALSQHRYGRFVGRKTMRFVSRVFARNVSGVGGNTALGFLLGMTPSVGKFFGVPLEVRHVTLSTGAYVLAVLALGREQALAEGALPALAGLGAVFVLNFLVSFSLALFVALRAREVERGGSLRLLRAVIGHVARHPREFLLPPRG